MFPSDFLRQSESVTSHVTVDTWHVSRPGPGGWWRESPLLLDQIWMVAKYCMILHRLRMALIRVPHWSIGSVEACDWSIVEWSPSLCSTDSRMARVWTLKCSLCIRAAAGVTCHCLAPGWGSHLIVPTERRKSFEINLKVGSRLVEVLFEPFLLVVSCRYRCLTSKAGSPVCSTVPTVAGELEARKFWKDQYVHFCCE